MKKVYLWIFLGLIILIPIALIVIHQLIPKEDYVNFNGVKIPDFVVVSDSENQFNYQYPSKLNAEKINEIYLPYDNRKVEGYNGYFHTANSEYCAPSGSCSSTTQDFEFRQAVIKDSIAQIEKKLGKETKMEKIGPFNVLTFTQGVEGEGQNYYFIALPNNKTLYFTQRYLDESILRKYQTVPDFIPLEKQNQMMRDIISSIKLTN